ncbi:hypothetical protein DEU56DRAFT_11108 [Suillus clintonianus]|uniref:uncharacterized protein n=1 Tax=Suillus clintonianus TaxID=1904413 RepID=UPI001B87D198|nr:uncharacterized protein DEU56DRAFT_11108 [Suillus clintonianus]KAG2157253.1 hypothetical protein DEU56DRAFT_11108 [Suillus clintonianus]
MSDRALSTSNGTNGLRRKATRKFLRCSPVFQVVNSNICKDRFLFQFNDILVIAKPRPEDPNIVLENVVLLRQLFFTSEREEPCSRTIPRTPAVQAFIEQFSTDPDNAVASLFSSLGQCDDHAGAALAQLLLRTPHIDRVQLGDYLSRCSSRVVLKHSLDAFGFIGLRVDKALRLFLQSGMWGNHSVTSLSTFSSSRSQIGGVSHSIHRERLCQARTPTSGGPPEITVTFKCSLPPWLTYRVQSEPVIIRIPQPDPPIESSRSQSSSVSHNQIHISVLSYLDTIWCLTHLCCICDEVGGSFFPGDRALFWMSQGGSLVRKIRTTHTNVPGVNLCRLPPQL